MKVFMLRNPASHFGCSLREKETGTVSDQLGKRLLSAGIAVLIPEPAPVIQAIPDPPAIAEAKPIEIAADPPPAVSVSVPVSVPTEDSLPPKVKFPWQENPAAVPIPKVRKSKNKES